MIEFYTNKKTISANEGDSLLTVLRQNGFFINNPCGGAGTCGKCIVHTPQGDILSCVTLVDSSLTEITVPEAESKVSIINTYERLSPVTCTRNADKPYGIAIDIGTTTIAMELLNNKTGERIATASAVNSQRQFGADVITRILNATKGHANELTGLVKKDIADGVLHILKTSGVAASDISHVVIAGNTTMLHLLLGYPCDSLGVAPFTPISLKMEEREYSELFDRTLDSKVIILPGMSTFVGADISAGLLATGWPNITGHNLLIDLGTNGEMALFDENGQVLITSTAAGPALEGGNISQGMPSVSGAIAKIKYNGTAFEYETINDAPPIGLCGTGIIGLGAEIIRYRLIDEVGYIESGDDEIPITPHISLTQKDIREIQLAKSAIRAGLEILLESANIKYSDLRNVYLCGGFGYRINLQNAATLGIIPKELTNKVITVGNSSLGGAALVLCCIYAQEDITKLTDIAKEINLSTHPKFNELFMEYMTME